MRADRYMFEDAWLVDVVGSRNEHERLEAIDSSNDRMASFLASYPYKKNGDLVKEFGIDITKVIKIAKQFGLKKLVDHRGGHNRKKVVLMNLDGYVLRVYNSVSEAADMLGISYTNLLKMMGSKKRRLIMPGATLVYRK